MTSCFINAHKKFQILNAGKRLWSKTAAHGTDAQQVKAALFLGQKGLEIADVPDRLKNLATTRNLEPLNPVVHTDIEGFLRNEHENAILSGTVTPCNLSVSRTSAASPFYKSLSLSSKATVAKSMLSCSHF